MESPAVAVTLPRGFVLNAVCRAVSWSAVSYLDDVQFLAPMGLEQDAVDLLQVNCFGAVADGLEQGADAEDSFAGADDERERVVRELVEDEAGEGVRC
jgi:hypothetical protein